MKREEAVVACREVLFCRLPGGSEGNDGKRTEYSVSGFRPKTQGSRCKVGPLRSLKYALRDKVRYCAVGSIALRNGPDSEPVGRQTALEQKHSAPH